MFDAELREAASNLLSLARAAKLRLATAESCTGGLIAAVLTSVPGSSDVLDRGFVTYSNEAKSDLLGVDPTLIERHGAVSEAVASQMAAGALARADAGITVSVTGIAGPGGGSAEKPVGLVFIATSAHIANAGGVLTECQRHEFGDLGREEIRRATVLSAISQLAVRIGARAAP